MPKPSSLNSAEKYKQFIRSLELLGVALIQADFKIDRTEYLEKNEEQISIQFGGRLNENTPDFLEVLATLLVRSESGNEESGSVTINANYMVAFRCKHQIEDQFVEQFVDSDIRLLVWPYMREFVASVCSRAHVPPISLPLTGNE